MSMRYDYISVATKNAAAYARYRGDSEITPDDLLLGALQAVARLRVVRLGDITIDLCEYSPVPERVHGTGNGPRYSPATARLFDEASAIARGDGEGRVRVVHLLAAFGDKECELMRDLAKRHSVEDVKWRAALAVWDQEQKEHQSRQKDAGSLMSVDEASAALDVHPQTIRGYIKTGKLPAFRIAGERAIRVLASDLYGLLEPVETVVE